MNKIFLWIFMLSFTSTVIAQAPTNQISKEQSDLGQENFATNVGQQTYIYGLPMMLNYRFANIIKSLIKKSEDSSFKVKFANVDGVLTYNKWIHVITLPTHETQTLTTPNDDTNYSIFFADLTTDAIVLTIPAIKNRYFSIALGDAYVENTDYISSSNGDVNGGDFLLLGPDFKGIVPQNKFKKIFKMRSNVFGFVSRIQVREPREDIKKVVALQTQFKANSFSQFIKKTGVDQFKPLEVYPNPQKALEWYAYLFEKMKVNKPTSQDNALLKSLHSIGIDLDKKIDLNLLPAPVKAGLEKGFQQGKEVLQWYTNIGPKKSTNNWFYSFDRGEPHQDYLFRAYYSLIGLYTNTKSEAIYPQTIFDSKGEKLTGKYTYQMTIPNDKTNSSKAFWSIITYQGSDFVPNQYFHYSVGEQKEFPIKRNADGSITITFSHEPPSNGELNNWLATPEEGKDFRVLYRMYVPNPDLLSENGLDSYLPPIIKMN